MNRTARCLRLLMILKSRGVVGTSELALLLQTNPRNIREYVRDLQDAGFPVKSVRGKSGGYQLQRSALPPVPVLSERQVSALVQVRDFLLASPDLILSDEVIVMLDVLIAAGSVSADDSVHFQSRTAAKIKPSEREMIQTIQKAIASQTVLLFSYQSLSEQKAQTRRVNPYELICSEGRWYLCAYDRNRRGYRNFRVSEQRMSDVRPDLDQFIRDPSFRIQDHIGHDGLMPGQGEVYKVVVRQESVRQFLETDWGADLKLTGKKEDVFEFSFFSDSPRRVYRTLTRFGPDAKLIHPEKRVQEYTEELKRILANYEGIDHSYQ